MKKTRILVVDDEEGMLEVCADTLRKLPGAEVLLQRHSDRAAEQILAERFDLLILDIRMPGLNGVDLLRKAREHDSDLVVVMLTAFPEVETAVESMKLGAADYLTKPFIPEDLLATVRRLLEDKRLREENRLLSRHVERAYLFDEIIGKSHAMQRVFETIQQLADANADVLILGETGTGKELVARSVHRRSCRKNNRFVPVDCGAIPEDLLESEFFGHERGAFTGAHARSLGLLEFADKGTFFLDEIGELAPRLQAKLLRFLQERRIRRVGGKQEIDIDVRVIAATSRNLEEEIQQKRFRMDLYYRINVGKIELPPLRERVEDIALLMEHFVARYIREMGKNQMQVEPDVLEVLSRYSWPGNVRELQNVIKRAIMMSRSEVISLEDLPDELVVQAAERPAKSGGFFDLREEHMMTFEKNYLSDLLSTCRGDVSQAAREAQMPRGTFYRLLKKYELNPADFRQ